MEGVPWLRGSKGADPQDGGCILQVIDWIDRGEWTDSPQCVLPAFRDMAINANDSLPDDKRQQLLDLAGRLRGTQYAPGRLANGQIVNPLTDEQFAYNRRANAWLLDWLVSNEAGSSRTKWGYDYLGRLKAALDAFEQAFGKQRPIESTEIDWQPIYNYLRQFELNGEFDSYHSEAERLTTSA